MTTTIPPAWIRAGAGAYSDTEGDRYGRMEAALAAVLPLILDNFAAWRRRSLAEYSMHDYDHAAVFRAWARERGVKLEGGEQLSKPPSAEAEGLSLNRPGGFPVPPRRP